MLRFTPNRLARDFFHLNQKFYKSYKGEGLTSLLARVFGEGGEQYLMAQDPLSGGKRVGTIGGHFDEQIVEFGTIELV